MIEVEKPAPVGESQAVFGSHFAWRIYKEKYSMDGLEEWGETAHRVATNVMAALEYPADHPLVVEIERLIFERKFMPGGRYLYASGRGLHQTQNCVLLKADDSREGWAELMYKSSMALMTGAGIGVVYSDVRPKNAVIQKTGGLATGPGALGSIINEIGRRVMQGGARRSAIWAGIHWWHPDAYDWTEIKNWSKEDRDRKAADYNYPCEFDMTNVSLILDRDFFDAFEDPDYRLVKQMPWGEIVVTHKTAQDIYWKTLNRMVKTGEPGFSIDYDNPNECLRNACTEIVSEDDSDICNLGSINLSRIDSIEELAEVTDLATLFLLAGTVYSHVPYPGVEITRSKNRRLGLGLMGVHEWLLKRGYRYEANEELGKWLAKWVEVSDDAAESYAHDHLLSVPVGRRSIAPNGTIGILAETTTSAEPIFAVAYKRMNIQNGDKWVYEYVVDPTARRLIESGVTTPDKIEDAYMLSYDVERRVAFQAWLQQYVDQGISSTVNLPYPITDPAEVEDFGKMLYPYLPKLRGITAYPDGARGGQPLTSVPYEVAIAQLGVVFEEDEARCVGGVCGT